MVSGFWNIVPWTFKYLIKGTQQVIYWSIPFSGNQGRSLELQIKFISDMKGKNLIPCSPLNYSTERVYKTEWTYCTIIIFTSPFINLFCNWTNVKKLSQSHKTWVGQICAFSNTSFLGWKKSHFFSSIVRSTVDLLQAIGREDKIQYKIAVALLYVQQCIKALQNEQWWIMEISCYSTILSFFDYKFIKD